MILRLVDYTREFLDLSWQWLNDEELRRLTDTPFFTRSEQEKWFKGISQRKDYMVWGLEAECEKIGVCGLKNITDIDCEYWGYIGLKGYWGKGLGRQMMKLMEEEARKMRLGSMWLKVLDTNQRAISLYVKMNYMTVSKQNGLILMRKIL